MSQLRRLVEETVGALAALDANVLDRLQSEIEAVAAAGLSADDLASDNLSTAAMANRLLGALLRETERNLRLFETTSPCYAKRAPGMGCYASSWI